VIHVRRIVTQRGPLYIEGALAFVRVTPAEGGDPVFDRQLPSYIEDWSGDASLPSGRYVLASFVRACGVGGCDRPGTPAEECFAPLDVHAGTELDVTITYRVTKGCSIEVGAADPPSAWSLDCGEGGGLASLTNIDYVADAKGATGDPVDLARDHFEGLRETDEVRLVRWTEAQATVAVIRQGAVIATAHYTNDGRGGWLLETVSRCEGSGLIG
jgi:hypothetical protein